MEFNARGDLAVLLVDGRAAVISYFSENRGASWWAGHKYSSVLIYSFRSALTNSPRKK